MSHSHTIYDSGSISLSGTTTTTTSSNGNHIHTTSLAAEGNDGAFGNSAPNMYNEAIGGVPNKFMTTALTSWAGNHNHTVSLTVSGGQHNHGGATGNSGSNETRPKNVALLYIIRGK